MYKCEKMQILSPTIGTLQPCIHSTRLDANTCSGHSSPGLSLKLTETKCLKDFFIVGMAIVVSW